MQAQPKDKILYQGNEISFVVREERGFAKPLVLYPEAVGIIPAEKLNGRIYLYLIEQFRIGAGKMSLEIPAGKMKEGESAMECARRELAEEAGLTAESYCNIISYYPAIGFCTEILHIWLATRLGQTKPNPDDDELITGQKKVSLEDMELLINTGVIQDAKTLLVYYMFLSGKIVL